MFIKVILSDRSHDIYINSDHIVSVDPVSHLLIPKDGKGVYDVTPDSVAYFLFCIEAQTALTDAADVPAEPPSLKTRTAVALRDDFPNGVSYADLLEHVKGIDTNYTGAELTEVLRELQAENVITKPDNKPAFFQHRANLQTLDL